MHGDLKLDSNLVAAGVLIVGLVVFFYTMSVWFWGAVIIFILFLGVSFAIVAGGEKEDEREARMKQMEERIKQLEENQRAKESGATSEDEDA
jgi:flagellar biosynthesis/type III secretory pathway M-ring protein FliF/YscJ